MRNPDRIDEFCKKLAQIWKEKAPDWRFGQLTMNVYSSMNIDPFFPEEDEMIQIIENFFSPKESKED